MKNLKLISILGLLLAAVMVVADTGWSPVFAKDTLEVIRDKDKTVYSIDSDDDAVREDERDKERAWQMLQNGNIWIDGRQPRPVPGSAGR